MQLHTGRCLLVSLALTASTAWASDRTFDQHFTAPPGGQLVVDTDVGAITVIGHDSRDLSVHADIDGSDADRIKITAEQTASGVRVTGRSPDNGWFLFHFTSGRVRITVETPRDYALQLKTSGGPIEVRAISADVRGSTSGGPIDLSDITGTVDMHTSGGGIDAQNIKGSVRLRSSGGPLDIRNVTGDLDVHTSGGGIELRDVDGRIDADTSGGGVRVEARSNHGISLSTSGGPITLRIPADVHASLEAHTSGGHVHSDLPVTVRDASESNRLEGDINGGGERIMLHSSGGSIHIEKLP